MAQDFKFDFNLPASPDANIDPVLYKELLIIYNSMRLLADQIENMYRRVVRFNGNYNVGDIVNFYDPGDGIPTVRYANYGGPEAQGFVSVRRDASGYGEVKTVGYIEYGTSITIPGQPIWSGATPGTISGASPGANSQRIGYFVTDRIMWFNAIVRP